MSSCCHRISFYHMHPNGVHFEYFGAPSIYGQDVQNTLQQCEEKHQQELDKLHSESEVQIQQLSEKLSNAYNVWLEDMQQQIPGFVIKLLNLIIPKVQITQESLSELILPLLEKTSEDQNLIVHISQDNQSFLEDLKDKMGADSKITWTVDPALKSGDVVLETPSGSLDNRLQSRLKTLKNRWAHYSA